MSGLSSGLPGVRVRAYGTWESPITPSMAAASSLRLGAVAMDDGSSYWTEGRPREGGRTVVVKRDRRGVVSDATPPDMNVRSRVHEYGGGAWTVSGGTLIFVNFSDQRVYRLSPGGSPEALTPEPDADVTSGQVASPQCAFADFIVDTRRNHIVCVREDHRHAPEPANTLVRLSLDGSPTTGDVIASGHDFYATPRMSPDGEWLTWIAWRHPFMPWEQSELWLAAVADDGTLHDARQLAGGTRESIYQPGWSPDGVLHFVSDRDGWWRLYRFDRLDADVSPVPVAKDPPAFAEFGRPQWIFGTNTWVFSNPSRIVASYTRRGAWHLATIDVQTGTVTTIPNVAPREWLDASGDEVLLITSSSSQPNVVATLDLSHGSLEVLRTASVVSVDPAYVSLPTAIEYPTTLGRTAHAFYYAPKSRDHIAPPGARPPLIVVSHGGPTAAASPAFDLEVQFWTSRGFAVVDVNYGGSSGYGREYRDRLNGQWGVVDVDDCIHAARYLAAQGKADRQRFIIRGGSAGGYTTLAALTFHPTVFAAGASYYGISDLEALVRDSHKFESHSLDSLVGPYPAMKDAYRVRSPIHYVDRLARPLILFQGLEDRVVPPNQSELMASAVRAKGLPVAYLTFEGEAHGFRRAETIAACLEAELAFYRQALW